jgi:hypothetical protein
LNSINTSSEIAIDAPRKVSAAAPIPNCAAVIQVARRTHSTAIVPRIPPGRITSKKTRTIAATIRLITELIIRIYIKQECKMIHKVKKVTHLPPLPYLK